MVIVDTSVFVRHFRGGDDSQFKELLLNDQILLSSFVRLELLQGVRKTELRHLTHVLGGLEPLLPAGETLFIEAEKMLHRLKSSGLVVGIVDLLLAAEANQQKCPIYSLDRIFEKLAKLRLVAVL
jgi:predicted nucleic acid-binding protein